MANKTPKTIILEVYNNNPKSDFEKAEVVITTTHSETLLYGQDHHKETIPTDQFLKNFDQYNFENPILTEPPAKKTNNTFILEYSTPEEFYLTYRKLFASLLHSPGENCRFKIQPAENFPHYKKDRKIYFSMSPNKKAKQLLAVPILENILTKWREVYFGSALAGYTMKNKYHYCEHAVIDEEFSMDELPSTVDTSALYTKDDIDPESINDAILDKIELRFIDENVGFGIFAREEIKKGDPVIAYLGRKVKLGSYIKSTYAMTNHKDMLELETDGASFGNLALFINHANKHDHKNPTTITSNIDALPCFINGINQTIYVASKRIPAGAQLLFDYGEEYWTNQTAFHFTGRNVVVSESGKKLKRSLPHYRKMIRYMAGQGIRDAQLRIAYKIVGASIGLIAFIYLIRLTHIASPTVF